MNKTITNFIKNNPSLLNTYVYVGEVVANVVSVPLERLMKHLLEVQGLNPNAPTGDKLLTDLDAHFKSMDDTKDLPKDFDQKWISKQFEKLKNNDKTVGISKQEFFKLTDLNKVQDIQPPKKPVKTKQLNKKVTKKNVKSKR
jgi:hypothetical protein